MSPSLHAGLESFKLKQQNRRERKRRAKERKREQKGGSDGQKIVQTLASKLKMKSKSAPELVHYQDPRKKRKQQEGDQSSSFVGKKRRREMIADDTKDEVTMKQARLDVFKFGVSGFGKSQKVDLETANLIRLGAKPPKNKCHSLTELKEMRKKEKLEEQQAKEMQRISGVRMARPNASAPTKVKKKGNNKAKSGSSGIQAKLGKFDGGMLRLGASDIAKIKGGKR